MYEINWKSQQQVLNRLRWSDIEKAQTTWMKNWEKKNGEIMTAL